jgi:hypothetical protein
MPTNLQYNAGIMKYDEKTKRVLADPRAGKITFEVVN